MRVGIVGAQKVKIPCVLFGGAKAPSYIYGIIIKIKVMTNPTMFSHALLEQIVYDLQKSNSITDPCVVDDLITCIKTHAKVEFKQI